MRTLGFACQIIDGKADVFKDGKVVADNLTFMGVVAISDPVRLDVPAAVAECMNAGGAIYECFTSIEVII